MERDGMTAYLVVELAITDPVAFARYRELVPPTVAAYDGRYLVRGGAMVPLEGDWHPERVTIIAFPSVERARAWWDSTEYADPKAIRQAATTTRMVIVEGV